MKKSLIALAIVFVLFLGLNAVIPAAPANKATTTIKIGVLLPKSGTWNATGTAAEKTLKAALPFVNDFLATSNLKISLDIRDTKSDPQTALKALESLKQAGITTVIGPMISEESLAVLDYANANDMLLLSPSATARELSLPDNFFRMVGTDESQVDGLTQIIKTVYQKQHLITVYVDDAYGRGYQDYLNQMASKQGIDIVGSVAITADAQSLTTAAATLKELAATADAATTAVVIVCPSQTAADLIKDLANDEKLSAMKWFASADIIGNQTILSDSQAAAFLEKTGMEGLTLGDKGIALDALPYISSLLNGATDYSPYAITTWDAIWLLADTYAHNPEADFQTQKQNLVSLSASFRNAYGSFNTMDANGDTKGSKFMRYLCVKNGDNYSWSCKGHFVNLGTGAPIILTTDTKIATDAQVIQVGALLPLTGNRSENGQEIQTILEYAITQFNAYAKSLGSQLSLSLVVADTGSDAKQAQTAAQKLVDSGIKTIIGPINSTELEAVKPLIDAAGVITISPLSSSPSLAQNDRIYRLVLNDSVETKALTALFKQKGLEKLVIVHADDSYGNDMVGLMQQTFPGEVVSIAYDATSDSSMTTAVTQAEAAVQSGDRQKTAVLTASYNEVAGLLDAIGSNSVLKQVPWYGTDSSALSKAVLSDQQAADTAAQVDYTTIDFTPYGDKFDPLYYVINSELNQKEPLKESLISSFDGIWLLGCAYLSNGTSASLDQLNSYVSTGAFHGVGGVLSLDKNGDRQIGYYKFYHLVPDATGYSWTSDGLYSQDLLKPGVLEMK